MVTLLEFRKLEDAFNKAVNIYKDFKNTESFGDESPKVIKSQEELYAYRDLMAEKIKSATQLYNKQTETRKSLIKLGSVSSYVDVICKCSKCGETYKSLQNIYADFDFNTAFCEECISNAMNTKTADIICNAKNVKGVFDTDGDLIEITFESNGQLFNVFNERKDGMYNTLTLEQE
jgi:hypothetical protein